jgi:hypothetical protein
MKSVSGGRPVVARRRADDDYPELEAGDFPAIYNFAAHRGRRVAS